MEVGLLGDKVIFCIQARVKSNRLPGKIFFDFYGEKIINRIISICLKCTNPSNIFILTGSKENNSIIEDATSLSGIKVVYGSENDLYRRYKDFVSNTTQNCKYFFRITSDNYLIQPDILKAMANDLINSDVSYSFVKPLSHFAGELISRDFFLQYNPDMITPSIQEHVTTDIRSSKNIKIKSYDSDFMDINHNLNITIDDIDDFIMMKKIEKLNLCKNVDCISDINQLKKHFEI